MNHENCAQAQEPCRWFCPIHRIHHPVSNMVEDHVEAAAPRVGIRLAE